MLERHVYVYFTQILKLANDPTLTESIRIMTVALILVNFVQTIIKLAELRHSNSSSYMKTDRFIILVSGYNLYICIT